MPARIAQGLKRVLAPARSIPPMPWSAHGRTWSSPRPLALVVLLAGLWLFGIGEAALIDASLGNTPWTALADMQPFLPHPGSIPARTLEAAAGIATIGVASALYLTANLGPGPRDGWMTGLHRRLGYPIASVRATIELTVLVVGLALGGTVGVATFSFALLVGYCFALTLRVLAWIAPAGDQLAVDAVEVDAG